MLHILRHIRRSFFLPGKVRTYLAYAVGEIVLIVVGILLALKVSEWNESRKDRIEEGKMLSRITEELRDQLRTMERWKEGIAEKDIALNMVLNAAKGEPIQDKTTFLSAVKDSLLLAWSVPQLRTFTFDEFVSSGKLGLIRDVEVRDRISYWYRRAEEMDRSISERTVDYAKEIEGLMRRSYLDQETSDFGKTDQEETPGNLDAIVTSSLIQPTLREINRTHYLQEQWVIADERINELITIIDAELAK